MEVVSYNLVLITDSEGIKHPTRSLCSYLILGFASSASFFLYRGELGVTITHVAKGESDPIVFEIHIQWSHTVTCL